VATLRQQTAGTWNDMAIELVQKIGRCTTAMTQDIRETIFLFQCLSLALQRGNVVSFLNTLNAKKSSKFNFYSAIQSTATNFGTIPRFPIAK